MNPSMRAPLLGDPAAPIYLLADAARYVRLNPSTARRWARHIPSRPPQHAAGALSFLDLISLQVMHELRRLGVKTTYVKRAEKHLTERLGEYPLARHTIWTDGVHVFFDPDSPLRCELPEYALESADLGGQRALVRLVHTYLRKVTYDERGFAIAWSPKERIMLHSARQFGQPCVQGTRITTEAIYSFYKGGDNVELIGESFGIPASDVLAAIDWEVSLLAAAA